MADVVAAAEVPPLFVAVTENEYDTPLVNPVTEHVVEVIATQFDVPPEAVKVYVSAFVTDDQERSTRPSPGLAVKLAGGIGTAP